MRRARRAWRVSDCFRVTRSSRAPARRGNTSCFRLSPAQHDTSSLVDVPGQALVFLPTCKIQTEFRVFFATHVADGLVMSFPVVQVSQTEHVATLCRLIIKVALRCVTLRAGPIKA